ncbi:MAG: 8-oxo-dGTP diphosphatase [Verrucomicrobiae bacterium]|nr:8-oxo-dGTP diphosphatase [Verrucomicrobiae bacterium]
MGGAAGRTDGWGEPAERAVLCFIVRGDEVLLIEKKRGLGAGKVNGPGGRIERGERPDEAAVRETREEIGVTPLGLRRGGALWFRFTDGYSLHCTVFRADGLEGEPTETDEAKPFWVPVGAIPFERMWADDIHWFHHLLGRVTFEGWFDFDGERMLDGRVVAEEAGGQSPTGRLRNS